VTFNATLELDAVQFKKCQKQLERLPKIATVAGQVAMEKIAEAYAEEVRVRYNSGQHTPLAASTIEKRLQGKRSGRSPRIPRVAGTKPLFRTGKLASMVTLKKRRSGKTGSTRVFVPANRKLTGGGSAQQVGATHEFGATFTVLAQVHVRAYLRALAMGVAGTNAKVKARSTRPLQITVRIPARPIWIPALQKIIQEQPMGPRGFARLFAQEFGRRLRVQVVFRAT
jgi:hypothetical protein